jgi:hypothetical protein
MATVLILSAANRELLDWRDPHFFLAGIECNRRTGEGKPAYGAAIAGCASVWRSHSGAHKKAPAGAEAVK